MAGIKIEEGSKEVKDKTDDIKITAGAGKSAAPAVIEFKCEWLKQLFKIMLDGVGPMERSPRSDSFIFKYRLGRC